MAVWDRCNGISITGGFGQRVDTHVPEIVPHIIAVEFKFISHVVTGAHAEGRVGAILLLQLRIQFFVQNSYLFITIHLLYSRESHHISRYSGFYSIIF